MNVAVVGRLGLYGTAKPLRNLDLESDLVGHCSEWSGSYHVLEMGRHFEEYGAGGVPAFPPMVDLPPNHPYGRLSAKQRAGAVTGNIGEVIAAIVAKENMGLSLEQFMHINPRESFRERKAPDYLMRLSLAGPQKFLAPLFFPATPSGPVWESGPQWWPVESKARMGSSHLSAARQEAFRQLAAYWHTIHSARGGEVGFGLVACYVYLTSRPLIDLTVFVPRDQTALRQRMESTTYTEYLKGLSDDAVSREALCGGTRP